MDVNVNAYNRDCFNAALSGKIIAIYLPNRNDLSLTTKLPNPAKECIIMKGGINLFIDFDLRIYRFSPDYRDGKTKEN